MTDKVQVYQGKDEQWYWRRRSENGQVVAEGGEGYADYGNAHVAAERENPNLPIVDENDRDPLA